MNIPSFSELGLSEATLAALAAKGFEEPTPIQALVIPALLAADRDLIGQAQTGTGKTAAFGLPLIDRLSPAAGFVQALVLTPTRELALQVAEEITSLQGSRGLRLATIYGGQSYSEQIRRLNRGVDLVVGTPGRVMDLMDQGKLNFDRLRYLVLDEADEMLNMGFVEDIEKILGQVNPERRMLLFSATMPPAILAVAKRFMQNPEVLKAQAAQRTAPLTAQIYYEVTEEDKFEALCRIVDLEEDFYGLVFCRTKIQCDDTTHRLSDRGYDAEAIHGDLSQVQREAVLKKFKARKLTILVATDVAARGIDVADLSHVINYHLPGDGESYVHRIGRTGRAGKAGTAITFITPSEFRRFHWLQRGTGQEVKKQAIPEVASILAAKRGRLEAQLEAALAADPEALWTDWAARLLEDRDPSLVTAALLKRLYADELDASVYGPVRDLSRPAPRKAPGRDFGPGRDFSSGGRDFGSGRDLGSGRSGAPGRPWEDIGAGETARLFLAFGRAEGYTARKVVELIKETAGTRDHKIDDVEVLDKGTYVTVPLREAEFILKAFRKQESAGRPVVNLVRKNPAGPAPKGFRKKSM